MAEDREEKVLSVDEAEVLELRELDVEALDAQVDEVWETIESMLEAEVVSTETLTSIISV